MKKKAILLLSSGAILVAAAFILLFDIIRLGISTPEVDVLDTAAPEIALNGEPKITVNQGENFVDPGATAKDGGLEIAVETSGRVNTSTPGTYLISYAATDMAGNTATIARTITVVPRKTGIIYLTFDDGPSTHTDRLLDVLKKYNVKATFFVTGSGSDDTLRREYNEGHAIALHTFSHNYSYIYNNINNFFEDLYKVQKRVENATGYKSTLIRFPGGSSNTVSAYYDNGQRIMSKLASEVTARGFTYFDWNVSSNDAGGATTSGQVFENVAHGVYNDGNSVVLQHDTKGFSVDAVEDIIKWGLKNGYTFEKLTASSFPAHHRISN